MINQVTIEGCLLDTAKIVSSKNNNNICFANFCIKTNKSYMKNGNWENKLFIFDVSYSTEKDNQILPKLTAGAHVLLTGHLVQEQFKNNSQIKIRCTTVGISPRIKNAFPSENVEKGNR